MKHQVLGVLTGGEASCSHPLNDNYSKIATAWSNYSPKNEQLKSWLDPFNTGETSISGYDPYTSLFEFDLGIKSVDSPSDALCNSDQFLPAVSLRNYGITPIQTCNVKYSLDGGEFTNMEWNGFLVSGGISRLVFPQKQISVGNHKIKFIVEKTNGLADYNAVNDTISKSFVVKAGVSLGLAVLTDANGSQNSWFLKDHFNKILYSGSDLEVNSKRNTFFCLDKGCYTFTMKDAGGDGLCCKAGNGYYSLYDNTSHDTIASGSSFGAISEKDFCIQTNPFDYDLELYSIIDPIKEYCTTNKFRPSLILKNKGNLPLTGAEISCFVDGQFLYDALWTGRLVQYAKDTLNLEYVKLADGLHQISFKLSRTDGHEEQNTVNDTLSTSVLIETKPVTHLEFYTDKRGSEISWDITDENHHTVYQGGPYPQDSILVDKQDFCLEPSKCYTYTVYDTGGDGVCCKNGFGHFFFYGDNRKDTIMYGNKYAYRTSNTVCAKTVPAKDVSHYNFKIFPNPTDGMVTFETDKNGVYEVWVSNLSGQQMGHYTFNSNISVFDCSGFPSGLYLFRFVGTDEIQTVKLVVTH